MKILSYRRFALWWQLAMDWFQRQFAAISASIDFTPVEEKLDDVKSNVADVKTAVENINVESADQVAQFFGVTEVHGYEFMTETEVTDELEDIMQALDNELTPEQEAAITTEAMQIIVRA